MISDDLFIALSFTLTFGVPLAFACREVFMTREATPGGGSRRDVEAPEPDLPPLPECLIPKPAKLRALERV